MSPNRRERENARRRYEKWQARQEEQRRRQARRRRNVAAATSALAVVAIVVGVLWWFGGRDDEADQTATPTVEATPTASVAASPSPSESAPATGKGLSCSAAAGPRAKSPSWKKAPDPATARGKTFTLTLTTNCGPVVARLDGDKAPQAVAATAFLAREGFYDKTPCHRLTMQGIYVLQCGDPTGTGGGGPGFEYGPVENAPKGDVYPAGTIAMARQGGKADSMGSQFFLVYRESPIPSDAAGGYTVLGQVTKGLDIVTKVAAAGVEGGTTDGKPVRAISITKATVKAG